MEKIKFSEVNSFFKENWPDKKEKPNEDEFVYSFGYSDYGGDLVDKSFIKLLGEKYPDNIEVINTSYSGESAVVFGKKLVEEIEEKTSVYLLGFENIEEIYIELENELIREGTEFFINEIKSDYKIKSKNKVRLFIEENELIKVNGVNFDYSTNNVTNELMNNNLIKLRSNSNGTR